MPPNAQKCLRENIYESRGKEVFYCRKTTSHLVKGHQKILKSQESRQKLLEQLQAKEVSNF